MNITLGEFIKERSLIILHKVMTSRKFLLAFFVAVFGSVAMWMGKIPADTWKQIVIWVLGPYLISQGAVDAATALAPKAVKPPEQPK